MVGKKKKAQPKKNRKGYYADIYVETDVVRDILEQAADLSEEGRTYLIAALKRL